MNFDDIKLSTMSPGTYTIRAIFDGDETYNPKTVEFILVVGERPEDTHIVIPLDEEGEKQYIELSFTESVVTIEEDLTTNKYQLQMPNNPKNVSLVWRCDNDNVLFDLENNSIILPNIGVYTIYAVFAGDDDYYPSTASYTLRLTDDEGNTERAQRHYNFYFDEYETTIYERDDHLYTLPTVKSKREDDIPQSMLDLCTWTIDETTVPYSNGYSMQIDELGTYTLTFSFAGNEDWLPQTLEYKITIKEKENPELSFDNLYLVLQRNVEGKYIMQPLNNPHNLSPIKWAVSTTQESMIRLDPDQKICYVSTGQGQYPIVAIFEGNDIYKRQQVVYNLRIISSQEDAELSFEYEYMEFESNTPIGNDGDRYPLQRLYNPAGLPVTWSIDTLSATLDIDPNREYNQVVFFHTVRNAVISVDFAGDDYYSPMHAQYTITYINWEERITPTLSFDNPVETFQTNMSQEYALQMPNNPLSLPLEWSITHSDHASVDADARKVYIEEFNFYTVTASFAGNDEYKPVSASYEIHLGKEEATIWFDHPIDTIWSFPDGYSYVLQIQPALTSPEGLPVKYYSNSTDCVVDEKNMVLIVRKRGTYTIQGLFEGDYIYDPCSARYYVRATDEKDPNLPDTKIDIDLSFENATVNIQYIQGTDYYELQQPYNPYNVELDWSVVSTDGNPCAVSGNYLLCWSTGVYQITARFAGNDYYNPASATYTIVMYEESVEKQDIDLAFFDYNVRDYVHDDGMYEYQEAYWKLTSEDESHWRPARDLLEIEYSISPSGEIRTYPTDLAYGQAYIEAGKGIYKIRADFRGNGLYNPAWTEYYLNIGNATIEPVDSGISISSAISYDENWPTFLYNIPTITNPNNLDLTITYGDGIVIRNGQMYIEETGDYTMTVSFAGNETYLPYSGTCTITIVPEVIVKHDVTISFSQLSVTGSFIDFYTNEMDPQQPTLSEDMPIVWSINNSGVIRGTYIEERGTLVEVRNPKIYIENEGTYTVTASFVGDRYRNPASASYTLAISRLEAPISFTNAVVEQQYNDSGNPIYILQTATNPESLPLSYALEFDDNWISIDPSIGITNIGSVGDWTIRAVFNGNTEYNPKTITYTLRVVGAYTNIVQATYPTKSYSYVVTDTSIQEYLLIAPTLSQDIEVDVTYSIEYTKDQSVITSSTPYIDNNKLYVPYGYNNVVISAQVYSRSQEYIIQYDDLSYSISISYNIVEVQFDNIVASDSHTKYMYFSPNQSAYPNTRSSKVIYTEYNTTDRRLEISNVYPNSSQIDMTHYGNVDYNIGYNEVQSERGIAYELAVMMNNSNSNYYCQFILTDDVTSDIYNITAYQGTFSCAANATYYNTRVFFQNISNSSVDIYFDNDLAELGYVTYVSYSNSNSWSRPYLHDTGNGIYEYNTPNANGLYYVYTLNPGQVLAIADYSNSTPVINDFYKHIYTNNSSSNFIISGRDISTTDYTPSNRGEYYNPNILFTYQY